MGRIWGAVDGDGNIVGCLGALVTPDVNTGGLMASEMFWFMRPEARRSTAAVRLLAAFEAWARGRGAKWMSMVHLSGNINADALKRLYLRRGYRPVETHYAKELA